MVNIRLSFYKGFMNQEFGNIKNNIFEPLLILLKNTDFYNVTTVLEMLLLEGRHFLLNEIKSLLFF